MGVFERSDKEKILTSSLVVSIFVALLSAVGLLILKANQLSSHSSIVDKKVGIGPVELFVISKTPLDGGGFQASIGPRSGLLIYFAIWLIIGSILAYIRLKLFVRGSTSHKDNASD